MKNEIINIYFIHGSLPISRKSKKSKRLMGILGGHVLIELNGFVYSFTYKQKRIYLFSKLNQKNKNGVFKKEKVEVWNKETSWEKSSIITLQAESKKIKYLENTLESYILNPPFDYTFFGKRCCSVHYKLLLNAQIIKKSLALRVFSFVPYIYKEAFIFFYKKHAIKYNVNQGCKSRIWI